MKGHDFLLSPLYLQACRLTLAVAAIAAMTGTAFGAVTLTNVTSEDHTNVTIADHGSSGSGGAMRNEGSSTLVDYSADTLPPPPWVFISNGPPQERSQHTVFVQGGVLHMIDNALLVGNTLGFLQFVPFDPDQVIEVEFRTRVLSGESELDERAPFTVWLYNGTVYADLAVGPRSITALGGQESRPTTPTIILNKPINGTDWHVYRYRLDPRGIQWWVDGISVGSATIEMLIPAVASETDRRINMFITSASANVELDYLIVKQSPQPPCTLNLEASFTDGTLTLDFEVGTREPATWNVWLIAQAEVTPLVSAALPMIEPPVPVELTLPFFPALGTAGFLTTLTTPTQGIICSAFETADTGPSGMAAASSPQTLQDLIGPSVEALPEWLLQHMRR